MARKVILIDYRFTSGNFTSGNHEIASHTLCSVPENATRVQIKKEVHEHILNFWGVRGVHCKGSQTYYFFDSELAITVVGWKVLNDIHLAVLRDLGLTRGY